MEKNKIRIFGFVSVILILSISLTTVCASDGFFSIFESSPEGMVSYNFDSAFTMYVPENTTFLKTWLNADESLLFSGEYKDFFSKENEFAVTFIDSNMINDERINYLLEDENVKIEQSGDNIIAHYPDRDGKIEKSLEDTYFKEAIAIHKGSKLVIIEGNDLDFLKSMADTIEFRE